MDSTKLIALVAAGTSGSSLLSGSLFSGSAGLGDSVRLSNPFFGFDLDCTFKKSNDLNIFELEPNHLMMGVQDIPATLTLSLPNPTANTGDEVSACYKSIFHQTPETYQIAGARVEMAATRGNYGFVLLNTIANMKNYGGKISAFRALFLEKKASKWDIKGGIQWSDETLLKAARTTQKLQMNDATGQLKEVVWFKDYTDELDFKGLIDHSAKERDYLIFKWNPDTSQSKNIYQGLTIQPQSPIKTQDFWSGEVEPLNANSNITRPVALFDIRDKLWKKTTSRVDINTLKPWFDLFKDKKGSWQKKLPS